MSPLCGILNSEVHRCGRCRYPADHRCGAEHLGKTGRCPRLNLLYLLFRSGWCGVPCQKSFGAAPNQPHIAYQRKIEIMSSKTDVDQLIELPHEELEERLAVCRSRVQARIDRAQNEQRDLTEREAGLCQADKDEISALRDAFELRAQSDARRKLVGEVVTNAIQQRDNSSPLFPSAHNLAILEEARARFQPMTVIEERAKILTTDMGTAVEYGPNGLQAPRTLWRAAGIPTTTPNGYSGVVPSITLPAGVAPVNESSNHGEFDGVAPDDVTIGRAGAWSSISSESLLSTSLTEVTAAHARIIARNVDVATVTKLEGTPEAVGIDEALVTVAAEVAADVSDLWIVGRPATVAELAGTATFTPANGADTGSYAIRYGGARLYITPAASAGELTVFHPGSYRAFATPMTSAVNVDPANGAQVFGQWMFYGIGQALVGSAITIEYGGGS